ncbi:hypothetical protein [Oceanibium sediminis]|uniref:hypothetical protein n=1 Tax=Oceanibium sediminis TaxID=2026339 RepID=UPI000DD49A0D|nr:hypothetical protein [Oceanibium sediminis]
MAVSDFASARVRQMPLGVQFFTFFVLSQALKYWALMAPAGTEGTSPRNLSLIALCFVPFVVARLPFMMPLLPQLLLRDHAKVELHPTGLIYTFDGVKRPLFVEWPDLEGIERTRHGLVLRVRNRANLTEAMPKYQAEFWRARISRPIRLIHVGAFHPAGAAARCLTRARQAGVTVTGFETGAGALASGAAPAR